MEVADSLYLVDIPQGPIQRCEHLRGVTFLRPYSKCCQRQEDIVGDAVSRVSIWDEISNMQLSEKETGLSH